MAFDSKDDHRRRAQSAASRHSTQQSNSPPPPAGTGQASTWFIALGVGFAIGVPVGAFFFPQADEFVPASEIVQVPAAQSAEQLAAAAARARKADEVAAAVKWPLPGLRAQKTQEQAADPGQAAAPQQPAEPQAAAAPHAHEPAQTAPPTAAVQPLPHAAPAAAASRATAPGLPRLGSAPGMPSASPSPHAPAPAAAAASTAPVAQLAPSPGAPAAPPMAPAMAPGAPPVAANGQDVRSVDELLDQALASSGHLPQPATRTEPVPPTNTRPLSPSREDVTRVMTVLLPAIRGCAAGKSGLANVGIVVKSDGQVQSVSVTGAPFEGDRSGSCMEGVVRRARFPRFQQSSFRIQFPFAIQ